MKYFVYSFMWKVPGYDYVSYGAGLFAGEDVTKLYEMSVSQGPSQEWCITSISEISSLEYELAKDRGIIKNEILPMRARKV